MSVGQQLSFAMIGQKRPFAVDLGGAAKVPRVDSGPGWSCLRCGNHNYESRTVCNMRSCQATRDGVLPSEMQASPAASPASSDGNWNCVKCGNLNFAHRAVCNMRNCGAPRDGFPAAAAAPSTARGGPIAPGQGWTCEKCGNLNFEGRIYCNMRSCGAPGPWTCPACNNKNFAGRMVCNMKRCGQPIPPPLAGAGPLATAGAGLAAFGPQGAQAAQAAQAIALLRQAGLADVPGVAQGIQSIVASGVVGGVAPATSGRMVSAGAVEVKEGSWVCLACGNINFPNRDVCNARTCGRARSEVDGGSPAAGADSKTRIKPGSWVCGACNNINFPERETCGMRKCNLPRAQVDAGPAVGA